jgi:hypothetical protein
MYSVLQDVHCFTNVHTHVKIGVRSDIIYNLFILLLMYILYFFITLQCFMPDDDCIGVETCSVE